MSTPNTGVYPVYENQFQVGATKESLSNIANMESFSPSFDNGVEEWNPMENAGWVSRLPTSKSITISFTGKRTIGDTGNDYVAGLAFANGRAAEGCLQWTFKDGTTVLFENAVFNVTALGAGDSTGVAPLEFEVMSNGKPIVTPAV